LIRGGGKEEGGGIIYTQKYLRNRDEKKDLVNQEKPGHTQGCSDQVEIKVSLGKMERGKKRVFGVHEGISLQVKKRSPDHPSNAED